MPDDRNLLSLDTSLAIPTRVLRFEDSGLEDQERPSGRWMTAPQ
jgi:hypothetical protein